MKARGLIEDERVNCVQGLADSVQRIMIIEMNTKSQYHSNLSPCFLYFLRPLVARGALVLGFPVWMTRCWEPYAKAESN
jgi:hypothetical protein